MITEVHNSTIPDGNYLIIMVMVSGQLRSLECNITNVWSMDQLAYELGEFFENSCSLVSINRLD